jgi:hypothetical protein
VLRSGDTEAFAQLAAHTAEASRVEASTPYAGGMAQAQGEGGEEGVASLSSQSPSSTIRRRLQENAGAIRACAGTSEALAVEAEWDSSGQVELRLRGSDDAAVHECLNSIFGVWTVDVPEAGRLIHAIASE